MPLPEQFNVQEQIDAAVANWLQSASFDTLKAAYLQGKPVQTVLNGVFSHFNTVYLEEETQKILAISAKFSTQQKVLDEQEQNADAVTAVEITSQIASIRQEIRAFEENKPLVPIQEQMEELTTQLQSLQQQTDQYESQLRFLENLIPKKERMEAEVATLPNLQRQLDAAIERHAELVPQLARNSEVRAQYDQVIHQEAEKLRNNDRQMGLFREGIGRNAREVAACKQTLQSGEQRLRMTSEQLSRLGSQLNEIRQRLREKEILLSPVSLPHQHSHNAPPHLHTHTTPKTPQVVVTSAHVTGHEHPHVSLPSNTALSLEIKGLRDQESQLAQGFQRCLEEEKSLQINPGYDSAALIKQVHDKEEYIRTLEIQVQDVTTLHATLEKRLLALKGLQKTTEQEGVDLKSKMRNLDSEKQFISTEMRRIQAIGSGDPDMQIVSTQRKREKNSLNVDLTTLLVKDRRLRGERVALQKQQTSLLQEQAVRVDKLKGLMSQQQSLQARQSERDTRSSVCYTITTPIYTMTTPIGTQLSAQLFSEYGVEISQLKQLLAKNLKVVGEQIYRFATGDFFVRAIEAASDGTLLASNVAVGLKQVITLAQQKSQHQQALLAANLKVDEALKASEALLTTELRQLEAQFKMQADKLNRTFVEATAKRRSTLSDEPSNLPTLDAKRVSIEKEIATIGQSQRERKQKQDEKKAQYDQIATTDRARLQFWHRMVLVSVVLMITGALLGAACWGFPALLLGGYGFAAAVTAMGIGSIILLASAFHKRQLNQVIRADKQCQLSSEGQYSEAFDADEKTLLALKKSHATTMVEYQAEKTRLDTMISEIDKASNAPIFDNESELYETRMKATAASVDSIAASLSQSMNTLWGERRGIFSQKLACDTQIEAIRLGV